MLPSTNCPGSSKTPFFSPPLARTSSSGASKTLEYFSHDDAKSEAFLLEPRKFAPDAKRKWQELFGDLEDKSVNSGGIAMFRDSRSYQFISDTPKIWREFSRSLVDDVGSERSEIAEIGMGKGITKRYKITRKNGVETVEAVN